MLRSLVVCLIAASSAAEPSDFLNVAKQRAGDLCLSVYATAGSVINMADAQEARDEAIAAINGLGITRIYIEVYRSGTVVPPEKLAAVRDFFKANGLTVAGGIATTPGGGFGVASNTGLHWFNFQAPETQQALAQVMRQSAPLFDTMIVDDFLCTGDTSEISNQARGERSWSQYRRDLIVQVSKDVLIGPAKEANPSIKMIIKFPQWYDLFHVYGYDTARLPGLYDGVYVGTETRGANTQRYGFVQPYEGFINYRWLAALSGDKIGGAWFDHGDCGEYEFIDQAWQSVAAGARELVFFHLGDIVKGHPDHDRLRAEFNDLADLAVIIRNNPVVGVVGYKPPNSDAGDDLYIMDFIGMLGVSIVPSPVFPVNPESVFLPTQAAADPEISAKIDAALQNGAHIIVTPGFLANAPGREKLAAMAGLAAPVSLQPLEAEAVEDGEGAAPVPGGLDLASDLLLAPEPDRRDFPIPPDLEPKAFYALVNGKKVPLLTSRIVEKGCFTILNVRTFSQADFDAVGEVLLCPRRLGLLDLPLAFTARLRAELSRRLGLYMGLHPAFPLTSRVTSQQITKDSWLIQNYTGEWTEPAIDGTISPTPDKIFSVRGSELVIQKQGGLIFLPPHGRVLVKRAADAGLHEEVRTLGGQPLPPKAE